LGPLAGLSTRRQHLIPTKATVARSNQLPRTAREWSFEACTAKSSMESHRATRSRRRGDLYAVIYFPPIHVPSTPSFPIVQIIIPHPLPIDPPIDSPCFLQVTTHCPMTRRPSCSMHAAIRRREFMSGSLKTALEPLVIVTRSFPSRTMPSVDLHTSLRLWPNLGDLVDPLARIFSR
jgi:hypothetical protein